MKNRIAIFLILFAFSCKQPQSVEQAKTTAPEPVPVETAMPITLDNGNPWQANPETTQGIKNMQALLSAFTDTENAEAYGPLTSALEKEFGLIFERCTMTGEAHEQLHHFLIPIKLLLDKMGSKDLAVSKQSIQDLRLHLDSYPRYFK